jgi:hypothetical protein
MTGGLSHFNLKTGQNAGGFSVSPKTVSLSPSCLKLIRLDVSPSIVIS